jgi:membrane protein
VNVIDRATAAWNSAIAWSRARSRVFDHVWLARERYNAEFGPRLAAAIAYYGFFAAFALGLLAYSVLGYVLAGNKAAVASVDNWLKHNLPFLNPQEIYNSRNTIAIVGLIGLVFTGVGWVDGMRSSQRAMWDLDQQPGNVFIRRLVDLAMLVGLGLLLALSLWATSGVNDLAGYFLHMAIGKSTSATILRGMGEVSSGLINLLMSAGLMIAVPRLRVTVRRMIGPILLVGLGLTLLNTLGRLYVSHTENNPAYRLAGAAVGLLLFLNLFSQLLLFGAALAATSRRGAVTDLAAGPPPPPPQPQPEAGNSGPAAGHDGVAPATTGRPPAGSARTPARSAGNDDPGAGERP